MKNKLTTYIFDKNITSKHKFLSKKRREAFMYLDFIIKNQTNHL